MVFTTLTPFPWEMTPMANVQGVSYADGTTWLRELAEIKNWLNTILVPETNDALANAIAEFQNGIANAEQTITDAQALWVTDHASAVAGWQAAFDALEADYDTFKTSTTADITAEKLEWQTSFDAFMTDVENQLAALNDAAVAGLLGNQGSATGTALDLAVLRKAVGRGERYVSVRDAPYNGVGNGTGNDSPAVQAAANAAMAAKVPLVFPAGDWAIGTVIDFSAATAPVHIITDRGARVRATGDNEVFTAKGSLNPISKGLTVSPAVNVRTITVDDNTWFTPGETVIIISSDVVPNTVENEKLGVMRRILSLTGATVANIDDPFYRPMLTASAARAHKVNWHPGFTVTGEGSIEGTWAVPGVGNPNGKQTLIRCEYVRNVRVGVELANNGGPGVTVSHCDGVDITGWIHDLKDDIANGYTGYGINCAGTTRNVRVNFRGDRCRHAFTTNTAPTLGGEFHGEPENIDIIAVTNRCSNKAIDTHRPGWNINVRVTDTGSFGALQIRADNVKASGIINGTYDSGVNVSAMVTVPPDLDNFTITGSGGADSYGVVVFAPTKIGKLITRSCKTGLRIEANDCRVSRVDAVGLATNTGSGVSVLGNNNTIAEIDVENTGTGLAELAGSTGNYFGRQRYGVNGTNRSLQVYAHEMATRMRERRTATALTGQPNGAIDLLDTAGNVFASIPTYPTASIT